MVIKSQIKWQVSITLPQNSSGTVTNEEENIGSVKKYLERDMYLQKKKENYWLSKINIIV